MADLLTERKKLICELLKDPRYVPMKEKELAVFMQVKPEDRAEFKRVLDSLVEEGRAVLTRRGRYAAPEERQRTGVFTANARGFGFVRAEGEDSDYFIPESCVHGAFCGDTVKVRILPGKHGQRTEAEVVEILARGFSRVVGTYQPGRSFGFVVPDNAKIGCDIFIPGGKSMGAAEGAKVVAEITDYVQDGRSPEGKVTEILGHISDPGVDILSIVRSYDLPEAFGERVLNQAQRVAGEMRVSEADRAGRRDLREVMMVTIDGEDAKDLDDAVSLTVEGGIYHLGVHIADVTNYVQENSALDREAKERGTSVYLADRVIPMLPPVLSNGICSLNAGEDRLALSCLMDIDKKGNVVDYEIVESVIRVKRRMSYTEVQKLLEGSDGAATAGCREAGECEAAGERDEEAGERDEEAGERNEEAGERDEAPGECKALRPMLEEMAALSDILRKKRQERGAVDFDFPECKILLDSEGNPLKILPYERNAATRLIEDFMLAANETVAQHFYWMELPFVYRTHDRPDTDKMEKLGVFLHNFGYHIRLTGGSEIHPKELQKLLCRVEGTPEEAMISRLTLRSMKRARYTTECTGHFGLATRYYCHFTSPIRRYPDLQIHRIIKEFLRGRLSEERIGHYREILPQVAAHASQTERRADEAERETDKLKKVQYMESHIGEIFDAVVSGVTGWGLYVELPNTVEGLVHVASLEGDYFYFDEGRYELTGQMTGRTYKLGQRLKVKAVSADRLTRNIDFVLAKEEKDGEGSAETDCKQ